MKCIVDLGKDSTQVCVMVSYSFLKVATYRLGRLLTLAQISAVLAYCIQRLLLRV